ncbi:MAG: hypothetical protein AB8F78_14220 [Saprospiraceae bacterium]
MKSTKALLVIDMQKGSFIPATRRLDTNKGAGLMSVRGFFNTDCS